MKLNEHWVSRMLELPESGMGYQKVQVKLKNGELIPHAYVYNTEELVLPEDRKIDLAEIDDIILEE